MSKTVILGAGLAGLSAALALAPLPALIVSPCALGQGCSSAWAQGGIAAAVGADDNAKIHAQDTLAAGAGLNDAAIVAQTTNDGPDIIDWLIAQGAPFDRDEAGRLRLGLEAAHKKRRIVHATDATGRAVTESLIRQARATPSIEIMENATAQQLIVNNGIAAVALRRGNEQIAVATSRVVLATGGAAALWRDTTNPHENWGSGLALAAHAGATLGDLEFMQFHPTAIDTGGDPLPLASEALRGEGAILVDEKGERFIDELQPRDIVTRGIWRKIIHGHRVFLDARQAIGELFAARFPTIHALCLSAGIDPVHAPIPVRPAAHYHMGGVVTTARGRTDIAGLWACGEVACTGLHGANRLASNSLLEAVSFGRRVAEDIKHSATHVTAGKSDKILPPAEVESARIRALMSNHVGVIRDASGLQQAIDALSPLARSSAMALAGLMIATSAFKRQESRGAHVRSDFPQTDSTALRSTLRLADLKDFS